MWVSPLDSGERSHHNPMAAFAMGYHHQTNKNTFKENYTPDDRDGVLDRYINSIPILNLYLNMFIPAIVGIVCFSLAIAEQGTRDPNYFKFPMGIIGKVYANSMLALINSRMLVGSEETASTNFSALKFATTVPANNEDSTIHSHNGDVALNTEALRPLKGSHPEVV